MESEQKARAQEVVATSAAWLVTLRWGAVLAQLVTVALVAVVFGMQLRLLSLLVVTTLTVASNVALALAVRRQRLRQESWLFAVVVFDVLLLTALLHQSGGPLNPFSVLYLVHVTLGAVMLASRYVWPLVLLAISCFAMLFMHYAPMPLVWRLGDTKLNAHLQGMWVALVVAAVFIALFVTRLSARLRAHEDELRLSREKAAKNEQLAALTTLSAGAAHELSTPLATIQIVADELVRTAAHDARIVSEAELIREEVARCHAVLRRLSVRSGEAMGEAAMSVTIEEIETGLRARLGDDAARVDFAGRSNELLRLPLRTMIETLGVLIDNGLEASGADERVRVTLGVEKEAKTGRNCFDASVVDRGSGMDDATLRKLGEPFHSSKTERGGMGLGVFVARRTVDALGGTMEFRSALKAGTTVRVRVPSAKEGGAS